jgi:hypothetical protein
MSTELILLLVLIACTVQAVIGGLIARRRGKSFWFWLGVCFFIIFPIGFICMLIYTRDGNDLIP